MSVAQKLYDNGLITYMRTDSTYISPEYTSKLKEDIGVKYGDDYYKVPKKKKVKGAQEAHECIRPTGINIQLNKETFDDIDVKVYELIVRKTYESHMKPAEYDVIKTYLSTEESQMWGKFLMKSKRLKYLGYLIYSQNYAIEDPIYTNKIKNMLVFIKQSQEKQKTIHLSITMNQQL